MKLHVSLFIVLCTVKFIDASCLSYGHSCWGAHGKRSYNPRRELKPGELNDRWALFKITPERNEAFQFDKLFKDNDNLQTQKFQDLPSNDHQFAISEERSSNDDKDTNSNDLIIQNNEEYRQRHQPFMKPIQIVRLNKQSFEQ